MEDMILILSALTFALLFFLAAVFTTENVQIVFYVGAWGFLLAGLVIHRMGRKE